MFLGIVFQKSAKWTSTTPFIILRRRVTLTRGLKKRILSSSQFLVDQEVLQKYGHQGEINHLYGIDLETQIEIHCFQFSSILLILLIQLF